ncbi:unnamed protein product [Plutella xylostella]|uniref:(diamondback moth) hypothetical protein n=1 Tax=Plutella xylostella TaxID=51655 RepID=A0A8S4G7B2_PLUXY|nr:unnamed protein product [Plutella xylostella]
MNQLPYVLLACLASLMVNAKPSQTETKVEVIKSEGVESLASVDGTQGGDAEQSARQKRWYNFYGYGYPAAPFQAAGSFDQQGDTFLEIYRKLKDISSLVRNPSQQAPPPQIPIYIPVLFVPQRCNCGGQNDSVNVTNRFPEMDDTRQNWGIVTVDEEDNTTYNRPISFQPILPEEPLDRPPPPVEHGSAQGGVSAPAAPPVRPQPPTRPPPARGPPAGASGPPRVPNFAGGNPASNNTPGSAQEPSLCDGAVLSCCLRPKVTYECFASQGCDNISQIAFNGACAPSNLLNIVNKYQRFYASRAG